VGNLTKALQDKGYLVGATTVRRILREPGYRLRSNI
jgi:Rhodopirellula transposase.